MFYTNSDIRWTKHYYYRIHQFITVIEDMFLKFNINYIKSLDSVSMQNTSQFNQILIDSLVIELGVAEKKTLYVKTYHFYGTGFNMKWSNLVWGQKID